MATLARKKLDAERAQRASLARQPVYSEITYDGIRIPVVSTARPANESLQAHNPKNMGGVRMVVISLPRVKCLETGDE